GIWRIVKRSLPSPTEKLLWRQGNGVSIRRAAALPPRAAPLRAVLPGAFHASALLAGLAGALRLARLAGALRLARLARALRLARLAGAGPLARHARFRRARLDPRLQVDVVGVGDRIDPRAEDGAERAGGSQGHLDEEDGRVPRPGVVLDHQARAAGQPELEDVDREAEGVPAEGLALGAGQADRAHVVDAREAQRAHAQRRQHVGLPGQRERQPAVHHERPLAEGGLEPDRAEGEVRDDDRGGDQAALARALEPDTERAQLLHARAPGRAG